MTDMTNGDFSISGSDATDTVKQIIKKLVDANNHDRIFEKLNVILAGDGKFIGELLIEQEHTNIYGLLHGGFIASLIDVCGSIAMGTHQKKGNGVTVDLNISFINSGRLNETIAIEGTTLKVGRTLGFAEVLLRNKATGNIVAKGSLTKHVLNSDKYIMSA